MTLLETLSSVATDAPASDARLVEAAQSGDRLAFGALVEAHWRGLLGLARSVLAGGPQAEDLVQDALLTAWQRLADLRDPERFSPWVRRIVLRACLNHLRRAPRWEELPIDEPSGAPAAGDAAGRRLDVARALARLAPRQRAVIYLGAEGHSDREIGAILGIFAATVRVHRWRAAQRLRGILEDYR